MKARLDITVFCTHCDRSTKASAVGVTDNRIRGIDLVTFSDVKFPPLPDGTESAWSIVNDEARCPDCASGAGKAE